LSRKNSTLKQQQQQNYRLQKERLRHETLADENVHVGLMFGSKALIQLITNPLLVFFIFSFFECPQVLKSLRTKFSDFVFFGVVG